MKGTKQDSNEEPSKTDTIYDAITAFCAEHGGNTPSLRELLEYLKRYGLYIGMGTLRYHLDRLEDRGVIERNERGRIRIPGSKWQPK